ncbi:MAG: hypothetical protein IJU30_09225 [Lachnospiraceae bacterium]|nr:hypothetical protein [Lachnospiraceae bacterium]
MYNDKSEIRIGDLPLSLTAFLCLKRAGYQTLGDLAKARRRDIMDIRELTRRNLEEIVKCMDQYGLRFSGCISR